MDPNRTRIKTFIFLVPWYIFSSFLIANAALSSRDVHDIFVLSSRDVYNILMVVVWLIFLLSTLFSFCNAFIEFTLPPPLYDYEMLMVVVGWLLSLLSGLLLFTVFVSTRPLKLARSSILIEVILLTSFLLASWIYFPSHKTSNPKPWPTNLRHVTGSIHEEPSLIPIEIDHVAKADSHNPKETMRYDGNDTSRTSKNQRPEVSSGDRPSESWTPKAQDNSDVFEAALDPSTDVNEEHVLSDATAQFSKWLDSKLALLMYRSQSPAAPDSGDTTPRKCSSGENGTAKSQPPQKRKSTRKERERSAGEDTSDDSEVEDKRIKKRKTSIANEPRLFACPFFKNNPSRYCLKRSCAGPGFRSVARVKEHIYRCHQLPENKCNRCCHVFDSASGLSAHQRSIDSCEIRSEEKCEGIDANTKAQLRSKKRGPKMTEAERWLAVFMILFPNVTPLPDPYHIHLNSQSDNLEEYSEYLQRELPRLFRRELQASIEDLSPDSICDKLFSALAETLNLQAYRAFREAREMRTSRSTAELGTSDSDIEEGMNQTTQNPNASLVSACKHNGSVQANYEQLQPPVSFDSLLESVEVEDGANVSDAHVTDLLGFDADLSGLEFSSIFDLSAHEQTTKLDTDSGYGTTEIL